MNRNDATEVAFKNGYQQGLKDGRPKWIPIIERLPFEELKENGEAVEVIVQIRDAKGATALYFDDFDGGSFYSWDDLNNITVYPVEKWMPMPKV